MESDVRPTETSLSAAENIAVNSNHAIEYESEDSATTTSTSAVGIAAVNMTAVGIAGVGVDTRRTLSRLSKSDRKIGHWRVDNDGQVTYKKKPTSELMKAIQLGLGHSIGSLTAKAMRDLLYEDFNVIETVSFPREGSSVTGAHDCADFRFRTYAPTAFRYFRDVFKIPPADFLYSLCTNPLQEISNPGASGSIFYITDDDEFIIKTVQRKEAEFLQKLLPGYYMNLNQNPRTLLPKFYGLFCYQCGGKNIRFVIMNNVLPSCVHLHEKYDLKGSTYKRQASRQELLKAKPTLKDLDFLRLHPGGLIVPAEAYQALVRTIERDCRVLQSFKIMDYSLLLGVHKVSSESMTVGRQTSAVEETGDNCQQPESVDSQNVTVVRPKLRLAKYSTTMEAIQATTGDQIFGGIPAYNPNTQDSLQLYVGIIDILQSYRFAKKFEHTFKSLVHDANTISVHQPGFYAQRFQQFVTGSVFKKHVQQNARQSPTKRFAMFGTAALVTAAAATRKKSSIVSPTSETGDLRQPSVHVDRPMTAGLERKPDLLPQPTPPPSHSVSLVDVHVQVHSPTTLVGSSHRQPVLPLHSHHAVSTSLHSVSSTPSHTDQTDAAVSYTNSSPSISSLTASHTNVDVIREETPDSNDDAVRQSVPVTRAAADAEYDDGYDGHDADVDSEVVETTRL